MNIPRKTIGLLKILLSLLWMGLAALMLFYGIRAIHWFRDQADQTTAVLVENIDLVKALMTEITDVMDEVDQSLSTVETSMIDGGLILMESRPMVEKSSQLIIEDVPGTIDDIQTSMPAVIEAAKTIEKTLSLLSGFKFVIPIPLTADFQFDLGVDYNPEVSLAQSLTNLSGSLENIPDQMRTMEGDFVSADISMSVMSEDLLTIAHSLDKVREQLLDINPEIEGMVASLEGIKRSLETTQEAMPEFLKSTRAVLILLAVLLMLTQIPAIYNGYRLYADREAEDQEEGPHERGS